MWCLTSKESSEWCKTLQIDLPSASHLSPDLKAIADINIHRKDACLLSIAKLTSRIDDGWDSALLFVRNFEIWPNRNNFHLYYTLRRASGDPSRLEERPGHLFLAYEQPVLESFLHVALLAGWDFSVFWNTDRWRVFSSHDGPVMLGTTIDSLSSELSKIVSGLTPSP